MEWWNSMIEEVIRAAKPSDSSELIPRSPRPHCQFLSSVGGMFGHSGSADCDGDSGFEAIGTARSEDEGLSGDSTATRESEAAERSLATTDQGLISWIAPVFNKQVEDALKPLLSILRGVEEDEQKHQEKLLAIEKRKLALKNEIQLFTSHGTPSWNSPISQPQVGLANFTSNAASALEPMEDGTEGKGVSARRSSGSDGFLQPSKLSETDDKNLPIADNLVAFPDVGSCLSNDSNEGDHSVERKDHSSEGDPRHSDKNLPNLDKVVACSNVRCCLSDDSNEGVHSDEFKDQTEGDPRHSDKNLSNFDKVVACSNVRSCYSDDSNAGDRLDELKDRLSEGDHSHSVDLPKLDKVERREYLQLFREDWMEKTEKFVFGHPSRPPKIVTEDETSDGTKCVSLFGQILAASVMSSCSPGRASDAGHTLCLGSGEKLVEYEALSAGFSTLSEGGELKECDLSLGIDKNLPKLDKVVGCPRCASLDTKFCYYNNWNVNQPRYFCKGCQRYWTGGMTQVLRYETRPGLRREASQSPSQSSLMLRGPSPSRESASSFDAIRMPSAPYRQLLPLHRNRHITRYLSFETYASSQGSMTSGTEPSAEYPAPTLVQQIPLFGEPSSLVTQDAFNVNAIRTGFTPSIVSRTTYRHAHVASIDMSTLKDEREPLFTGNCNSFSELLWNEKQRAMHASQGGASLSTWLLDSDRPDVQPTGSCVSSAGQQHQPVSVLGKRGASDGGRQEGAQLPAKALRTDLVLWPKSEIVNPATKPKLEQARACEQENSFMDSSC